MPIYPIAVARSQLAEQIHYLRNPLPPGHDVCVVCRGPKTPDRELCRCCTEHRNRAGVHRLADAVVPISYAFRGHPDLSQHFWTLWNYKVTGSAGHRRHLTKLFRVFIDAHARCIGGRLGGQPDWYATVPSSRSRVDHPLHDIAGFSSVERLNPVINPDYRAEDRRFRLDAFRPFERDVTGSRVLVIDDTWVTGNTAQALAYRLKRDGAAAVLVMVLGRWADWRETAWKGLIQESAATTFDTESCVVGLCTPRPVGLRTVRGRTSRITSPVAVSVCDRGCALGPRLAPIVAYRPGGAGVWAAGAGSG